MVNKPDRPSADGWENLLADLRTSKDRRSSADRRGRNRRMVDLGAERQRRKNADRRGADRRTRRNRRVPSGDQFTWDETQRIHMMVRYPDRDAVCPRCAGQLILGPEERHDGIPTREIHCTRCRFGTVVAP